MEEMLLPPLPPEPPPPPLMFREPPLTFVPILAALPEAPALAAPVMPPDAPAAPVAALFMDWFAPPLSGPPLTPPWRGALPLKLLPLLTIVGAFEAAPYMR